MLILWFLTSILIIFVAGASNNERSNALECRTLKIPAVFRLLRPEFREQLKSHSCQVNMPTENGDDLNRTYRYKNLFF